MMTAGDDRTRAAGWPLAVLLLVALLARGLALWAAADASLVLDEQLYVLRAEALLDGHGFLGSWQSWVRHPGSPMMAALPQYPGAYQPPLYTAFLAAVLGITGRSVLAVKLAQVLLGTLTVLVVFALGRDWFDRTRGWIAAGLCALYPNLIAFTHYLWSETLFICWLLLAIWLLTRGRELPCLRDALAAGVLLGLAVLTRGSILFFLPVLAMWLAWVHRDRGRPALARAGAILLAALVVIAPWSVRNAVIHGGLVIVDTNGAFNLWRGNAPDTFADRGKGSSYAPPFAGVPLMPVAAQNQRRLVETVKRDLRTAAPTDLQIARYARALAIHGILENPGTFLGRAWIKTIDLWNPTSFLLRHFRIGAYGPTRPAVEAVISWSAVTAYLGVVLLGIVGFILARRDPRAWLVLLLALYLTGIHAVTFGLTRFRLPLMPFAIILTAHAVVAATRRAGWRLGT